MSRVINIVDVLLEGADEFDIHDIVSTTEPMKIERIASLKVWSRWQSERVVDDGLGRPFLEMPYPQGTKLSQDWKWLQKDGVPIQPTPSQLKRGYGVGYSAAVYLNRRHAVPYGESRTLYHGPNRQSDNVAARVVGVETIYFVLLDFHETALEECFNRNTNRYEAEKNGQNIWWSTEYNPPPPALRPEPPRPPPSLFAS